MDADALEDIYFAVAAIVVAFLTYHGWRQGVGRQFMTLLAVAGAYAVGFFGAGLVAPWFSFLRYPPQVTQIIAGVAAGLLTMIAISTLGRVFFKRTADQKAGAARWSFGVMGAVLGLAFGGLVFFVASEMVRLMGALAQANVQATTEMAAAAPDQKAPAVNPMMSGLAKLSSALDKGDSGTFFRKVDPVPAHVFATLAKLGLMVSRPEAVERFLGYPGVDELTNHPRLLALRNDPEVASLLERQSYFRLLRHPKVVELAGDPDFSAQIKRMNFDEALDYALKAPAEPRRRRYQVEAEEDRIERVQ